MSGTLLVKKKGGWKRNGCVLCGSIVITAAVDWVVLRRFPLQGAARSAVIAVLTYILFRVFYGELGRLLPEGGSAQTLEWTLSADTLTLGETVIPRETIRQVHCWPNRDSLGQDLPGWTVNIETDGKNQVLHSVPEGPERAPSERQLRALVCALGYAGAWPADTDGADAPEQSADGAGSES